MNGCSDVRPDRWVMSGCSEIGSDRSKESKIYCYLAFSLNNGFNC
jgi:hypothetical protein